MCDHVSVMPQQVLEYIAPASGGIYFDGTLGGGGHSRLILEASDPDGFLYAVDRDERALAVARENLRSFSGRTVIKYGDFRDPYILPDDESFDGIILDLGVSSFQLDMPEAGFSFRNDGPLDMRMDQTGGTKAADIVNEYPVDDIAVIIKKYGEERFARRIARAIETARENKAITTTFELAEIVRNAIPRQRSREKIDPATRTFQALRIAVNDELTELGESIERLANRLKSGGTIVVISFHSLEDRIVKWVFRQLAGDVPQYGMGDLPIKADETKTPFEILTRKPVIAGEGEQQENPRSRSAKLRALRKV